MEAAPRAQAHSNLTVGIAATSSHRPMRAQSNVLVIAAAILLGNTLSKLHQAMPHVLHRPSRSSSSRPVLPAPAEWNSSCRATKWIPTTTHMAQEAGQSPCITTEGVVDLGRGARVLLLPSLGDSLVVMDAQSCTSVSNRHFLSAQTRAHTDVWSVL